MKSYNELLIRVKECPIKKVSVSVAQDANVIEAVRVAKDKNIADAILVGDKKQIEQIAKDTHTDISDFEIINVEDVTEASLEAVKLVHDGVANMYMKGIIDTKGFLKSVLNKEVGLRTGRPLSHVCVFDCDALDRLLFLTDVAFIPYPTVEEKVAMIDNTLEITSALGITDPKVALMAAVEVVNPKMPATVEAGEITQMYKDGKIKGCIVDGPLSLDLAIDPEAAVHKGCTDRPIQGDADILLFPDIQAGNLVYKTFVHLVPSVCGNILTGTKAPVILTSRSDSVEVKVNSLALGAAVADSMGKA